MKKKTGSCIWRNNLRHGSAKYRLGLLLLQASTKYPQPPPSYTDKRNLFVLKYNIIDVIDFGV